MSDTTSAPTTPPSLEPTPLQPASSEATTASTVKVHDVSHVADTIFWTSHAAGLVLVCLSIIAIFVAKGPKRREALKALAELQKKS